MDGAAERTVHRAAEQTPAHRTNRRARATPFRRTTRLAGAVPRASAGLLLAAVLIWCAAPGAAWAADAESIHSYQTTVDVGRDGRLRITETIEYDFGANSRHGIIRRIPARFRYDDTHDRIYPIDDVTVTMDGATVPMRRSAGEGYETFTIGDPDRTVTGAHIYGIGYTVRGALNSFADHEELYWNVIGTEWSVPIDSAAATVTGPVGIQRVECFAGPPQSRLGCAEKSVTGTTATFRQPGLGVDSGLSVVVAFPKGSITDTAPILTRRRDLAAAFRATPVTVAVASMLALLGVAGAVIIAWLVGRDRHYLGQLPGLTPLAGEPAVEHRKPLFGAPPVSVEFVPPQKVRPGQVGTLIDEHANVIDVTATIIDFAVRRHLHIAELPRESTWSAQDWELSKLTDGDATFLPYERTLFDALFDQRERVRLSELKNTFAVDLHRVQRQLYTDMVGQGWYRQSPITTRTAARALALLVLALSVAGTALLAFVSQAALIGVGLVVGALMLVAVAGRFPARTGRGSAMLARVQGFRLYVATAEAEQIKFQEREKIFSEYLPFAMVFGLADRWAGIFAKVGAISPNSNGLYWYAGQPGWSLLFFAASIGSFTTTTVGTIASTPPSAAGTTGFSGGFSGGGGGGGGGGSW
jgi:Predicted membrane protein (DUF2207)